MRSLFSVLTLFIFFNTKAQSSKEAELLTDREEWYEGSILLSNGEELKGMVRYNDNNGILGYNDGSNSRAYGERSVTGFEFFDERVQRQRTFYTLEYNDPQSDIRRPMFFEVLRDYQTFAILLRANPIEVKQKRLNNTSDPFYSDNTVNPFKQNTIRVDVKQVETVYLMNEEGDVYPYFEITSTDDGSKSVFNGKDTKVKSSMIDKDLLAQYVTEPIYDKLVTYANENSLKFKRKDDFMKILEYYDALR